MTAALAMLLPSYVFALPPAYTLQAGLGSDDVASNSDSFYHLAGSVLISKVLSSNSMIDLLGEVSSIDYADMDNLSGEEIFLQGSYRYTPRAGFRVPTYSLGLGHSEEYLADGRYDASTTTLTLSISYRIDDRISLLGGVKSGTRDANYDSDPTIYFVNFDYRYNPDWLFYTSLATGDGVLNSRSYCSNAYRSQPGNWSWSWNAAAYDCDFTYLTLGANYVINAFNNLDLSVSNRDYDTSAGNISGNIYSVDFFHRF